MTTNLIKSKLNRYGYEYSSYGSATVVELGYALRVRIVVTEQETITFEEKLGSGNYLQGMMEMRLGTAFVYNSVAILVVSMMIGFFLLESGLFWLPLFMAMIAWMVLWSVYYLVKLESFKQQVMGWVEQNSFTAV